MKPIFQSNARSRRHRQAQSSEPQTEQTPFFAAADQHEVQTKPQPFFQAKAAGVKIGQPNDVYEQEADAVADKVVNGQTAHSTNGSAAAGVQRLPITPLGSGSLQRLSTPEEDKMPGTNDARMAQDKEIQEKPEAGSPILQKMDAPKEEEKPVQKMGEKEEEPVQAKEEEEQPVQKMEAPKEEEPLQKMGEKEEEPVQTKEEEEQPVQAKASPGAQNTTPNLGARLSQKKGSGNPLPKSVRAEMEQGIGADFSGVRIHTDNDAVDMNKEVHAQAFTHGQDVYFNSGKFNPEQTEGKRLLAHELTHVVQQGGYNTNPIQRKIMIGGVVYEPSKEELKNYGETLAKLYGNNEDPIFNFDTKEDLLLELKFRQNQVLSAAQLLTSSVNNSCEFGANEAGAAALPTKYWELIGDNIFALKKVNDNTAKDITPSNAVKSIFESSSTQSYLDCNMMMVAIQYKSMLETFGEERFNQLFSGGTNLIIGQHHKIAEQNGGRAGEVGYPTESTKHPFWDKGLYGQLDVPNDIIIPHGDEGKYLIPGDWVYFKNFGDYKNLNPGGAWAGEHALYTGNQQFIGWGITNASSYDSIITKLYDAYLVGYESYWNARRGSALYDIKEANSKLNKDGVEYPKKANVPGIISIYRAKPTNINNLSK